MHNYMQVLLNQMLIITLNIYSSTYMYLINITQYLNV